MHLWIVLYVWGLIYIHLTVHALCHWLVYAYKRYNSANRAAVRAMACIKTHSLLPELHHLKMWKRGEKLHRTVSLMYHKCP